MDANEMSRRASEVNEKFNAGLEIEVLRGGRLVYVQLPDMKPMAAEVMAALGEQGFKRSNGSVAIWRPEM